MLDEEIKNETENTETEVSNEPTEEEPVKKKIKAKFDEFKDALEKAKAEVNHWKNEYYKAYADMKNLRNNLEKDHKDAVKYRAMGFVEEIIPILDSFQTVLQNEPESQDLKNYLVGFNYIYRNLVTVLQNEGVTEIAPAVNGLFDPNTMNAVDTVVGEKANIITKVHANGYKLHDRIVRPALVQVSVLKKDEEEKTEPEKETKADA